MLEREYLPTSDEEDLISFAKLQLCALGYTVRADYPGFRPRRQDPATGKIDHVVTLARGTAQVAKTRNGAWAMCADDHIRLTTEEPDRDLTTQILDLRGQRGPQR